MTENPNTIDFLRAALEMIRRAGNNEHPTAVWMQKVAAHALYPERFPFPDAATRDSHGWCELCKAPPAAPCYDWCRHGGIKSPELCRRPGCDKPTGSPVLAFCPEHAAPPAPYA